VKFFKTLHDEQGPTGYLGRGTHYSVLRAVVFHDAIGNPLPEGPLADFAVIWDEDHDTRVFEPIENIYRRGLLSSFLIFGERKGSFTAILSDDVHRKSPTDRLAVLKNEVNEICQSLEDPWPSEVLNLRSEGNPIIQAESKKVHLYLENLKMLWQLGIVPPKVAFNPILLKRSTNFHFQCDQTIVLGTRESSISAISFRRANLTCLAYLISAARDYMK